MMIVTIIVYRYCLNNIQNIGLVAGMSLIRDKDQGLKV